MTFGEAHDLMDLLLDKADQPYFTVEEKDKFLNLAYFDWFDKALDRYDSDPEIAKCIGKLVVRMEGRFEEYSQIYIHTARYGAQSVPYRVPSNDGASTPDLTDHGVPIGSYRSIGAYPFARLLHLQVRYVNDADGTLAKEWQNVELAKSNEHGLYYSDTSSDPFNKADDNNIKCYMRGPFIEVFPRRLQNGLALDGWGTMGTEGWENSGRWRARYITYPMASNVAAGDSDHANISNVPSEWGTRDLQMGSYTYAQGRDDTTGDLVYSNSPVGAKNWGWPMHICNEIVQNAVRLMTSNIEGANYQSQAIEAEQSRSV